MLKYLLTACLLVCAAAVPLQAADTAPLEDADFDATGVIDAVSDNTVVIDDKTFEFSANPEFWAFEGGMASRKSFMPGDYVGYLLDDNNKIEVLGKLKKEE